MTNPPRDSRRNARSSLPSKMGQVSIFCCMRFCSLVLEPAVIYPWFDKTYRYAEYNRPLRCAGGATYPIVGTSCLEIHLRSVGVGGYYAPSWCGACARPLRPPNIVAADYQCCQLLHRYLRGYNDAIFQATGCFPRASGSRIVFMCTGLISQTSKCMWGLPWGAILSPQVVKINDCHCSDGHSHEPLLRKTVKQIGMKLERELAPCSGCSQARGSRKPIKPYTTTRAVKPGGECSYI